MPCDAKKSANSSGFGRKSKKLAFFASPESAPLENMILRVTVSVVIEQRTANEAPQVFSPLLITDF